MLTYLWKWQLAWSGLRAADSETLKPVCSPKFMDSHDLRKAADLVDHRLIHVLGYREGWALWLKRAGVKNQIGGHGLQVDNSLIAFRLAAEGAGVALARSSMVPQDLAASGLVMPFELAVPVEEGFFLITREKMLAVQKIRVFRVG